MLHSTSMFLVTWATIVGTVMEKLDGLRGRGLRSPISARQPISALVIFFGGSRAWVGDQGLQLGLGIRLGVRDWDSRV
jgi:hypothetical protein